MELASKLLTGAVAASFICGAAYKAKALDMGGALAAWIVGFFTLSAGAPFAVTLLVFFISSTMLTRLGGKKKKKVDAEYKKGGQRTWQQVVGAAGVSTTCCLLYLLTVGTSKTLHTDFLYFTAERWQDVLSLAFIAQHACSTADTWASEVGSLSKTAPILVTSWAKVPPGTNGAITLLGTTAALCGGILIGSSFLLSAWLFGYSTSTLCQFPLIYFAGIIGLFGAMLDSFIGALFQFSGWDSNLQKIVNSPGVSVKHISGRHIFSNTQVNLISGIISAIVAIAVAPQFLS